MQGGKVSLEPRPDLLQRAEPRICAFDIETTKLPLQFPNAEYDQVCTFRSPSCSLNRPGIHLSGKHGCTISSFRRLWKFLSSCCC